MKRVIQTHTWNPFQTYMLVAAFLAGLLGLVFDNSSLITSYLPGWILCIWYSGLAVGALLGIVGVHIRFAYKLQTEMLGVSILGSVSLGYSTILLVVAGRPFAYSVILVAFFSLACTARVIQLYRQLRKLEKAQEVIA